VIRVEIVHARPQSSVVKFLELPPGALIEDALRMAARDPDFAGIDLEDSAVGIYGKTARRDQPLKDGDRLEIYRPLAEEPKLARRRRVSRSGRS
jgi:hypothetical protein